MKQGRPYTLVLSALFFTLLKIWSCEANALPSSFSHQESLKISAAQAPGPAALISPFLFEEISEETPHENSASLHSSGFPRRFSLDAVCTCFPRGHRSGGKDSPHSLFIRYCDLRL